MSKKLYILSIIAFLSVPFVARAATFPEVVYLRSPETNPALSPITWTISMDHEGLCMTDTYALSDENGLGGDGGTRISPNHSRAEWAMGVEIVFDEPVNFENVYFNCFYGDNVYSAGDLQEQNLSIILEEGGQEESTSDWSATTTEAFLTSADIFWFYFYLTLPPIAGGLAAILFVQFSVRWMVGKFRWY